MKRVTAPLVVGILVLFAAVAWFVFFSFVKKEGRWSTGLTVSALFRDASGLGKKSNVMIAGIKVGEILSDQLQLEGTKARVVMRIDPAIKVHTDAKITKRSQSLVLSDFVLDLYPGTDKAPLIPEGGEITNVVDSSGLDEITDHFKDITVKIDGVMADIQAVTHNLADVLGGQQGNGSMRKIVEDVAQIAETVNRTTGELARQLEAILKDVHGLTSEEQNSAKAIIENVKVITEDTESVMKTLKGIVGPNEGDLKESVSGIKQSLNKLDASLQNVKDITDKVAAGEGPIGTLLNDKRMARTLQDTVDQVGDFAQRLTGLETEVSLRSDFLFTDGRARTSAQLRLIPKPDKYYILEIVDDPRGVNSLQTVVNSPANPNTQVARQSVLTNSDSFKYSAEFAKRFYFVTLRFGIIESTGGIGLDLHILEEPPWLKWFSFTIRADVFDFSSSSICSDPATTGLCPGWPHVRAYGNFTGFRHIFVTAGIDDALNSVIRDPVFNSRVLYGRTWFLGAGIVFTDDDLKAILPVVPKP